MTVSRPLALFGGMPRQLSAVELADLFGFVNMSTAGCIKDDMLAAQHNSELLRQYLALARPLYFPTGVYYIDFDSIVMPTRACLLGDGYELSIVSWLPTDTAVRANMFEAAADVDTLLVHGVGFVGNRPYQVTPTENGHDLACFHLRAGSVRNVCFDTVGISDFGDGGTAGGGLLIGALDGAGRVIENIRVTGSRFLDISNVPGVYINGTADYHSMVRDITIERNTFSASVTAHQNALYVLGGSSSLPATGVQVTHNRFHIDATIDTCVELNYVTGFELDHNQIVCRNSASCVGLLVRESSLYGSIAHNVLVNLGSGNADTHGISLVRLATASQVGVCVANNVVLGWGCGGAGGGIYAGAGTVGLTITGNHIHGLGNTSTSRCGTAIQLAGVSRVHVSDNYIQNANYAAVLGAVNGGTIKDNTMFNVGDGSVGIIVEVVSNQAITNLSIKDNEVLQAVTGTPSFVSVSPAATTGNRIENNKLPASVQAVNPAHMQKWAAVVTPAATGALLAGKVYQFTQGALDIDNGGGFTIGANLDDTLDGFSAAAVSLGDTVLVAPPGDMQGVIHSAYVSAVNRVRIRVQNHTGAGVTVPGGAWRVTVIKTSAM